MTIPDTLAEVLTPAWLTGALRSRFPDVEVLTVTPGPVVSRVSTNARFRIEYLGGSTDGLPSDLCVKSYFDDTRGSGHAGVPEAYFYRELAGSLGMRTLRSVYAEVAPDQANGLVITEDVSARGGVFLDALSEYSIDNAARSLAELAKLHAATWQSSKWAEAQWLAPRLLQYSQVRGIKEISQNFDGPIGGGVPIAVREPQRLLEAHRAVSTDAASASPWCVIHGDAHIGNVYLDGTGPLWLDWQCVQRGPWYLDVGYHIASALAVEDRRRSEDDLLHHYLGELAACGVEGPKWDIARRLSRRGMIHGFYMWAITMKVEPGIRSTLLTRLGTAVDDHAAFGEVLETER
jgi:hypothetical protein